MPASVAGIMAAVLIAMFPGAALQTLVFGRGTLIHIGAALLTAMVVELVVSYARAELTDTGRSSITPKSSGIWDGSAAVTAVLIALAIPAGASWWVSVAATGFGLGVAKHLYGGLGQNVFNPAMAGYAFVLLSFPLEMTRWHSDPVWPWFFSSEAMQPSTSVIASTLTVDAMTGATPLDAYRADRVRRAPEMGFDYALGKEMWTLAGAYALGGCVLIGKRIIHWRMPVAMLGSIAGCASVFYWGSPQTSVPVIFHLVSGSAVIAAFFVVTDPVTAPMAPGAQWCFAITVGIVTFAIRLWGGYADGVAFAILFANMFTPALDRWLPPRGEPREP